MHSSRMHTACFGSHVCEGVGDGSGVHQKVITEGKSQPEGHNRKPHQKGKPEDHTRRP